MQPGRHVAGSEVATARRLRQPLPDLRDRALAPAVAAFTADDPRFDGKAWVCRHLSTLYRVWMVSRLSALGLGWPLLGASGARPDAPRLMAAARGIDLAPVAVGLCRYMTRHADRHRSLAAATPPGSALKPWRGTLPMEPTHGVADRL